MMQPSEHVAFLNPVCKLLMNGAKCAKCENYIGAFKESFYIPLHPGLMRMNVESKFAFVSMYALLTIYD